MSSEKINIWKKKEEPQKDSSNATKIKPLKLEEAPKQDPCLTSLKDLDISSLRRTSSAESSPRLTPKVFLNQYDFRVTKVRVLGEKGRDVLWKLEDEEIIARSSHQEVEMTLPVKLFSLSYFAREFTFRSAKPISCLHLEQLIYFEDNVVESLKFKLGYVMPKSENTWQNVIEVNKQAKDPKKLSGRVVIETKFWDQHKVIFISRVRVHYK